MNSLTDGAQSETLYIHLAQRYPETGGSIVSGFDDNIILYMTDKEQIEGVDVHAGVAIDVGYGKKIGYILAVNRETGFLQNLPDHPLFSRFVIIHETTGQVEGVLGWLLGPAGHQQLPFPIQDEGCRRGPWILVIGESATGTMSAQGIVNLEVGTTALRTEPE